MQLGGILSVSDQIFASLKIRNYRLYFIGQGLSHAGNWMQTVGLGWLVLGPMIVGSSKRQATRPPS